MLLIPALALADEEIGAATPNRYTTTSPTMDQGERLTFRNSDFASHDVTSEQAGLFSTPLIGQGESTFVEGSQYLTAGTYGFYCSVHSSMKGTLTVTSAGTPVPRPGGGGTPPAPDTTAPVITLKAGKLKASRLKGDRAVEYTVGADEAAELEVTIKIGSKRLGSAKLSLPAAGTRKLSIRLGKTARKSIKKGKRLTATAKAVDAAKNASSKTLSVKLG